MKGYKVTSSSRLRMYGVACNSLSQLRAKGSVKLGIDGDFFVALDDGTIVDDEKYFKLIPEQSILVFYRKSESVLTGADYILKALRAVNAGYLEVGEKVAEFVRSKDNDFVKMLEESRKLVDEGRSNTKDSDPDWFLGLDTNAATKEEFMFRKSQDRIRGFFYKFRGEAMRSLSYSSDPISRRHLDECVAFFKQKLPADEYFGCFFDRRCARAKDETDGNRRSQPKRPRTENAAGSGHPEYSKVSYCNDDGVFVCQGKWDSVQCSSLRHVINPYSSRESRILFSTWNLDHRIEKSRTVLPTLFDAVKNLKDGQSINHEYFYQLLFTNCNLKLVHIVCHDKRVHDAACDMSRVYKT